MTETPDDRVDLSPLEPEVVRRASRIAVGVADRLAVARLIATERTELWDGVRWQLARFALPAALVAAASLGAVLLISRPETPPPERFAAVVLEHGPARRWVVLGRRPQIPELVAVLEGTP